MKQIRIILVLTTMISTTLSVHFSVLSGSGPTMPDSDTTIFLPFVTKPNSLSEMIQIPGQFFWMGCSYEYNGDKPCYNDAKPLHPVYIDSFSIDKTEVSNSQYAQCVDAGFCNPPAYEFSESREKYFNNPIYSQYPVIFISWYDASNYCTWVGKRLPTEAEWEKTTRYIDPMSYPWGEENPTCMLANSKYLDLLGNWQYCLGDTTIVYDHPWGASPYGILNMAGNVYEWVQDWYSADYYQNSPTYNPGGPETGTLKVLRGGSWAFKSRYLSTSFRLMDYPYSQRNNIGFRCASNP